MWKLKLLKKLSLVLALLLLFVSQVFSQEDIVELKELQKIALELNSESSSSQNKSEILKQNCNLELNNVNNLKDNLSQSEMDLMNPFELLDQLEMTLNEAQKNYEAAIKSSLSLEKDLLNMKLELENSQKTLEELKKALLSNKDDTSYLVSELGELFEKVKKLNEVLESYKKIQKRLKILSYFEISVGVPCIILACLPIWTEEQKNIKNLLLGTGTASAASGLITFTFTINF